MMNLDEFALCVATAAVTFFAWPTLRRRYGWSTEGEWLFWTDALGVGVFAAAGANVADDHKVQWWGCAVSGMLTATFGGNNTANANPRNPLRTFTHNPIQSASLRDSPGRAP